MKEKASMKEKQQKLLDTFKKLIRNIFVQGFIVSAVIIVFIPDKFDKYQLDLIGKKKTPGYFLKPSGSMAYSRDINDDNKDEMIAVWNYHDRLCYLVVNEKVQLYDQWNFSGEFIDKGGSQLYFSDLDEDGKSETWGFTVRNDSLFLNAIEPFDKTSPFEVNLRFVTKLSREYHSKLDIKLNNGRFVDLNNDGKKEFVFLVKAGYNLFPRKIAVYYPYKDSLISRSLNGMSASGLTFFDFNGNGNKEIILKSTSNNNIPDSLDVRYPDDRTWLMVFSHDLNRFLFPPRSYSHEFGKLIPLSHIHDSKRLLALLSYSSSAGADSNYIQVLDKHGMQNYYLDLNTITNKDVSNLLKKDIGGKDRMLCFGETRIHLLTNDFKHEKTYDLDFIFGLMYNQRKSNSKEYLSDLNQNGSEEMIFSDKTKNSVHVISDNLEHTTSYPLNNDKLVHLFPVELKTQQIQIWGIGEKYIYKFNYGFNPLYYWQYAIYLGIFGGVLLFILAIQKLHEQQVKEKYELRNQVERLQLRTLQNKMDPHFVLNTTNSIGSAILKGDSRKAYNTLVRFSRLMRTMLYTSEDILQPLSDEIGFIREYLYFQQIRFGNKITYDLEIGGDVDQNQKVPKLCIFIHIENAVKHGITPKESPGHLLLRIEKEASFLVVSISDTGIGRKRAHNEDNGGNGYGLKILHEIYTIVNKHNYNKVKEQIKDLYDEKGNPSGTEVLVQIPVNLKYES